MMSGQVNRYVRGRRAEQYVKDLLRSMGADLVVRSAGSRGPVDLVAFFPDEGEVWLVQVKAGSRGLGREERERLEDLAARLQGLYFIRVCAAVKRRGRYEFIALGGGG